MKIKHKGVIRPFTGNPNKLKKDINQGYIIQYFLNEKLNLVKVEDLQILHQIAYPNALSYIISDEKFIYVFDHYQIRELNLDTGKEVVRYETAQQDTQTLGILTTGQVVKDVSIWDKSELISHHGEIIDYEKNKALYTWKDHLRFWFEFHQIGIFIDSAGGNIEGRDIRNASIAWHIDLPGEILHFNHFIFDHSLVFLQKLPKKPDALFPETQLVCIDLKSGELSWTSDSVPMQPFFYDQRDAIFILGGRYMTEVDIETGKIRRQQELKTLKEEAISISGADLAYPYLYFVGQKRRETYMSIVGRLNLLDLAIEYRSIVMAKKKNERQPSFSKIIHHENCLYIMTNNEELHIYEC